MADTQQQDSDEVTFSPAEFSQLDLDSIIYAPLAATIKAHMDAAQTTLAFVKQLSTAKNMTFTQTSKDGDNTTSKTISVPLLALVKTPNLTFDSLSIDFEYNISQVYSKTKDWNADINLDVSGTVAKVLGVGLKGGAGAKGSTSNAINKSGSMGIKLHASEAEMPEGLNKVITWLVEGVEGQTSNSAGGDNNDGNNNNGGGDNGGDDPQPDPNAQ